VTVAVDAAPESGREAAAPARPAFAGLLTGALAVFLVLIFAVSPFALNALGFDYSEAGGNPLTKLHPATFYISAVAAIALLATGRPFGAAVEVCRTSPSIVAMLAGTGLAAAHAALISGLPVTPLIETFVPAVLSLALLSRLPEGRGRVLALLIHALMIGNAVLGIGELLSGWRLTPFALKGVELEYEWRSTALLGHPLANALITGCYVLALALGGGRDLPWLARAGAFLVSLVAMATFGGRAATVLVLALLGVLLLRTALAFLNGARIRTGALLASLAAVPPVGMGLFLLASTNFFAHFVERFADDSGSAQTRSDMFVVFDKVPLVELLLGPDQRQVVTWQGMLGLERGIESFWLCFALFYGLAVSLVIFAGILMLCRDIVRACRPGAAWVLLFFIAVCSLSLSLAGKSNILAQVTVMLLVLLRQSTAQRAA
jgi:hypothetical protein